MLERFPAAHKLSEEMTIYFQMHILPPKQTLIPSHPYYPSSYLILCQQFTTTICPIMICPMCIFLLFGALGPVVLLDINFVNAFSLFEWDAINNSLCLGPGLKQISTREAWLKGRPPDATVPLSPMMLFFHAELTIQLTLVLDNVIPLAPSTVLLPLQ